MQSTFADLHLLASRLIDAADGARARSSVCRSDVSREYLDDALLGYLDDARFRGLHLASPDRLFLGSFGDLSGRGWSSLGSVS